MKPNTQVQESTQSK